MASGKSPLAVISSAATIDELHEIWVWNVENHGLAQGDAYSQFLADNIAKLAVDYAAGKPVKGRGICGTGLRAAV